MKKNDVLMLVLCFALFLTGCAKTVSGEAEMLQAVADAKDLSDDDSAQLLGVAESGDCALMCVMTGSEGKPHDYYAAEFEKKQDGYRLICVSDMYDRGQDMRSYPWDGAYVFACGNENCKSLLLRFPDGEEKQIAVDSFLLLSGGRRFRF